MPGACIRREILGMQRQSEPRAGNASLPTQANHTVRGARKQPPSAALAARCTRRCERQLGYMMVTTSVTVRVRFGCYKEMQWLGMYRNSETRAGNHRRHTRTRNASYQRRPTTLHEVQGSNPPIRALYMQLTKIPHTHYTTPRATIAGLRFRAAFALGALAVFRGPDQEAGFQRVLMPSNMLQIRILPKKLRQLPSSRYCLPN